MSQVFLETRNVTRTFGKGKSFIKAVREVSLSIGGGELAVIIGPSGSGKSTLLALISGLLTPTSGQCFSLGKNLWELDKQKRRKFRLANCGFIFQHHFLFPALTACQQLEMICRWGQKMTRREARAKSTEILETLGLRNKGHLLPIELSGGEKQRVSIGRALIKTPALVFADEPTSSLDWKRGEQIIKLLRDQTRSNNTSVVLVTHDTRVLEYADTVICLEDGMIVENKARFSPAIEQ